MAGPNRVYLGPTPEFPSLMTGRLTTMREGGVLTDFTITAMPNEPKIRCHKLVLSIHSPYFEAMFVHDTVESATNTVHYKEYSPETLRLIVDYCYHEQIDFPDDQLIPLIVASDFLQIERLTKRCLNEVRTFMTPENVLQYLTFAIEHSKQDIKSRCLEMVIKSFPEVSEQPAFKALTYAELQECLTKVVQSNMKRDEVLRAVFRWISDNSEERKEYLNELLQKVEPEKCSLAAISSTMDTYKALIESNATVLSLFAKSISHITAQVQKPCRSEKQLVIVGGHVNNKVNPECWSLDSKQKKFVKTCTIPFAELSEHHSVCEVPEGFAVTGGFDSSDLCVVFVASTKQWRKMKNLLRKRWVHGSVCVKGRLFVLCGGVAGIYKSASVDCLTLESGLWEPLPDAPVAAHWPQVAELNGKLLMLVAENNQLLQFDVEKKVWTYMASLPGATASLGSMVAVNGQLCVAGGLDRICAWYNPATNSWSVGQQKPSKEHIVGSLVQQDSTTLLLLGGNFSGGTDDIEELNIADGSWALSQLKMPVANMYGHKALYLDIPHD